MKRSYPSGAEKRKKQEESKKFLAKLPKLTNFFVMPGPADNDNNANTITTVSIAASVEELPVAAGADSASPGCSSDIAANVTCTAILQDEEDPSTAAAVTQDRSPKTTCSSKQIHIEDTIRTTKIQLQMSIHHCCVKTAEEK
ncbi:uncharacterized protein LOC109108853 [Cyprinus carpio]|uniref:Uncharacterized protein LOC109108853 n=1 Tax=Cyprinus carpio TaxID=7962 RepID=A0A9Q9W8M8_CYPCA|nr:uncharacterized protein LOC109108853 [Cyprinus carpio]